MPTVGIVIAVPDPWAVQLQQFRNNTGDIEAMTMSTHITLVPPLDVTEQQLPDVVGLLERTAANEPRFTITLDGTGSFRPVSDVVYVALSQGEAPCARLADALLRPPLDQARDFAYHPHVTVAQNVDQETLDDAERNLADFHCRFEVTKLNLYLQDVGQRWQRHSTYELGTGAQESYL